MGKVKKQRKQKRATPYGNGSMETENDEASDALMSVGTIPEGMTQGSNELPQLPQAYSNVTQESAYKMKSRHSAEWKKVRAEMEKLRSKRQKLGKHDPESFRQRKEILNQIKQLQIDYQTRVEKERASLKKTEVVKDLKTGESTAVLPPSPETLTSIQNNMEQKMALIMSQMAALQKKVKDQEEEIQSLRSKPANGSSDFGDDFSCFRKI